MADLVRHSALEGLQPFEDDAIRIHEADDFNLAQVSGFGKSFEVALAAQIGKLPAKVGIAESNGKCVALRIGPQQLWVIGELAETPSDCFVTPLSSSRSRIAIEGPRARDLLSRCAPLDLHEKAFRSGMFAQTSIHHTPTLVHCVSENLFHVYALRTFAVSVWDWVVDAAAGLEGQHDPVNS